MNAMVSGKAKERWARRSSPNSALSCTAANSSVEGSWGWVFEGGGVSVATESPRVAGGLRRGLDPARAPCRRSTAPREDRFKSYEFFRKSYPEVIAGRRDGEIASPCTTRHVPARAPPVARAVSFSDDFG